MARKTIRVNIPSNKPAEFISLAEQVSKKHLDLGEASPLNVSVQMDVFSGKLDQAKTLRDESKELRRTSESKMEEAMLNLGLAPGQNTNTPDTIYNLMLKIRDQLLVTYKGNEEKLSEWGFDVVIGQANTGRRA